MTFFALIVLGASLLQTSFPHPLTVKALNNTAPATVSLASTPFTQPSAAQSVQPELVGLFNFEIQIFYIDGDLAYGHEGSALLVFDVSEPTTPVILSKTLLPEQVVPSVIVVQDSIAYIGTGTANKLLFMDVSDPLAPQFLGSYLISEGIGDFQLVGTKGIVSSLGQLLYVIDLSDLFAPQLLDSIPACQFSGINDFTVQGSFIFASTYCGFHVIDWSDPTNLQLVDELTDPFSLDMNGPDSIAVEGNYIFGVTPQGLFTVDAQDPTQLAITAQTPEVTAGNSARIAVQNHIAYVSVWDGLKVVDLNNPNAPQVLNVYDYASSYKPLLFSDLLYLHPYLLDITASQTPVLLTTMFTDTLDIWDVAVSQGKAYVMSLRGYQSGLSIHDLSDPLSPQLLGDFETDETFTQLELKQNIAFISFYDPSTNEYGVMLLDVTDPVSMDELGRFIAEDYLYDVTVANQTLYAVDESKLYVVDISDVTDPTLSGTYTTSGTTRAVAVNGEYAYVADDIGGLLVVDVSDKSHPVLAGDFNMVAVDVTVYGTRAFVTYRSPFDYIGFLTLDVSDPENPISIDDHDVEYIDKVLVSEGNQRLYVTFSSSILGIGGINWYNLQNPSMYLGSIDTIPFDRQAIDEDFILAKEYPRDNVYIYQNPPNNFVFLPVTIRGN